MVFNLFKNGDERFDDAKDLIRRKEYEKATKALQKSLEKGGKERDDAESMLAVISLNGYLNDSYRLHNAANTLRSKGNNEFEFGLNTYIPEVLAVECDALGSAVDARNMPESRSDEQIAKGEALIKCAQVFQVKIGNNVIALKELYYNTSVTGITEAYQLLAEGNERIAAGNLWLDPKKAAEFEQIALNYRRQLGESGDENQRRILSYSRACTCWICGRDATGEGVHFFPMPSDISPQMRGTDSQNPLHSADDSYQSIYVCRACYSAVSKRADSISKYYYDRSIDELRAMEGRMQSQINTLQSRISSLQNQVTQVSLR